MRETLVLISLLSAMSFAAIGCERTPSHPSGSEHVAALSTPGLEVDSMPSWDATVLSQHPVAASYYTADDRARALSLGLPTLPAPEILGAPPKLEHLGAAALKRVYQSGTSVLMLRDVDRYLRFVRRDVPMTPIAVEPAAIPQEAEALTVAHGWFSRLGLPPEEAGDPIVRGIAAGGTFPDGTLPPAAVARLVEFPRLVNGIRVLDSQARFEFGPNSVLSAALLYWPPFVLRPEFTRLRSRQAVSDAISAWAAGRSAPSMSLVYTFDDDGFMVPGIMAITADGAGEFFPVAE
jgi:hypothetical protein